VSSRIDQNGAIIDHRVAVLSDPVFSGDFIVSHAAGRQIGAHAVGMSTVPEVILARRFGLKVAALSVITNLAAGIEGSSPSHAETKREGEKAAGDMIRLLKAFFTERMG